MVTAVSFISRRMMTGECQTGLFSSSWIWVISRFESSIALSSWLGYRVSEKIILVTECNATYKLFFTYDLYQCNKKNNYLSVACRSELWIFFLALVTNLVGKIELSALNKSNYRYFEHSSESVPGIPLQNVPPFSGKICC